MLDLEEVEGLYYLCRENKGSDQLHGYHAADLRLGFSHIQKSRFSHKTAHVMMFISIFRSLTCQVIRAHLSIIIQVR